MANGTPQTDFGIGGVGSLKGSFVGTDNGIVPDVHRASQENDHLMEQVATIPVSRASPLEEAAMWDVMSQDRAYVA